MKKAMKTSAEPGFNSQYFTGFHGGAFRPSDVKRSRPISTQQRMHVVLKTAKFRGFKTAKNFLFLKSLLKKQGRLNQVSFETITIDGGSIQFVSRCRSKSDFICFLRVITGLIARRMLGAEKGSAYFTDEGGLPKEYQKAGRFWMARPFTRIVKGRAHISTQKILNFKKPILVGFTPTACILNSA